MADLREGLPQHAAAQPDQAAAPAIEGPLTLTQRRKMFDEARQKTQDARNDSELSRDYYDGIQLTDAERRTLEGRKQPPVINNRIQRAIDGIMGVVEQGKTDPRALMRNPPDAAPQPPQGQPQPGQQVMGGNGGPPMEPTLDAGDVATMALRFIADTTHFPAIKMDVLENGLIEGCGAAIFEVDGSDVSVSQIRWEEFFYDPYSRRHDFKDARYMGVAKWMYADSLGALYPHAKDTMNGFSQSGQMPDTGGDSTWQDRPYTGTPWVDGALKRVMVVEMYHQTGGIWYRSVFYCNEDLEYGPSPYKNDKGTPDNPIEAWSAYVNRKNERYGVVKMMRDIQDEINKRRSKALHEINSRQIQRVDPNSQPVDANDVRDEAARPDGVIPAGWNIVPRQDVVANNIEMLAEAKSELERMAAAPAILGRQSADASGRAQQIRQQAGMTELSRVLGRHMDWQNRSYAQMFGRARQFWNDPKWVRVTNDTGAPQYIQINEPGPMQMGMGTGGVPMPMAGPPKHHIAQMDVDIVLEDVPDTATLEQEVFQELSQLAQVYGPQNVPFEVILEMSQLPRKRELIAKLKAYQAQQQPAQQAAQNATMAKAVADVEHTKAETSLTEAQTVVAAMEGHLTATSAAQLPPGYTLDANDQHVPLMAPPTPPPGATGVDGSQPPQG